MTATDARRVAETWLPFATLAVLLGGLLLQTGAAQHELRALVTQVERVASKLDAVDVRTVGELADHRARIQALEAREHHGNDR